MKIKQNRKLICGLVVLLTILQACQKSPDDDIVTNKNEGILESIIKEENTDGESRESAPETYTDSFTNSAGDVTVNVAANVEALDSELPVVRVMPHEITSDEVKQWAEVLFEGQTAYEPSTVLSKSEIEQQILLYKGLAGDKDALISEYGSESDAQSIIDYYNSIIASYEAMYETAPDNVEKKECDWTFHSYEYYLTDASTLDDNELEKLNKTNQLKIVASDVNGHSPIIDAVNRDSEDYKMNTLSFYYTDDDLLSDVPYKGLTVDEATSLADNIIEELGLTDWSLWSAVGKTDENTCEYTLCYTLSFSGADTIIGPGIDLQSDDLYAANYAYSQLEVVVYNGIIRSIILTSPMDMVEIENSNVATLSFDDVYSKFKTQMQNSYRLSSFIEGADENPDFADARIDIDVTSIQQGLFRIKEKNNDEEFLMVPAWLFVGSVTVNGENWGDSYLCLVNAVDGSIIDSNLGY